MRSGLALPQVRVDFINGALYRKERGIKKHLLKLEILRQIKASL